VHVRNPRKQCQNHSDPPIFKLKTTKQKEPISENTQIACETNVSQNQIETKAQPKGLDFTTYMHVAITLSY
jgi:hypothetical protein